MFTYIAQRNVNSMITGTFAAIGLIAAVMVFALSSLRLGLLSILPNALPIISGFGLWALLVGEVGFSVAAIASLSLGIVIDDTVHFMTKYVRGVRVHGLSGEDAVVSAFRQVGGAITASTLILMAGFGILAFSAFKINAELGMLTTMTIGLALVFDALFLPGLLIAVSGKQNGRTKDRPGENKD
jgi:predicted RND superfamily exporter protein